MLVRLAARWFPSQVAGRFEWLLDRMTDDGYASRSYRVFNIGEANKIPAYSSELAVSLEDGSAHRGGRPHPARSRPSGARASG